MSGNYSRVDGKPRSLCKAVLGIVLISILLAGGIAFGLVYYLPSSSSTPSTPVNVTRPLTHSSSTGPPQLFVPVLGPPPTSSYGGALYSTTTQVPSLAATTWAVNAMPPWATVVFQSIHYTGEYVQGTILATSAYNLDTIVHINVTAFSGSMSESLWTVSSASWLSSSSMLYYSSSSSTGTNTTHQHGKRGIDAGGGWDVEALHDDCNVARTQSLHVLFTNVQQHSDRSFFAHLRCRADIAVELYSAWIAIIVSVVVKQFTSPFFFF